MAIVLAATWKPRGEVKRFLKLHSQLREAYAALVISFPPDVSPDLLAALDGLDWVRVCVTEDWSHGRITALEGALALDCEYIHYADFDRLLRWVETEPEEWLLSLCEIQQHDCLIMERTAEAYQTHPQALVCTEMISNLVTSYLLGQEMDFSAGSKGFSRPAAAHLAAHAQRGFALGADAEWPLLLKNAGFSVDSLEVSGLDWETADRYKEQAANQPIQNSTAFRYDADPDNWAYRVEVALEIVRCGLEAADRQI
jgi:hypothetical protein